MGEDQSRSPDLPPVPSIDDIIADVEKDFKRQEEEDEAKKTNPWFPFEDEATFLFDAFCQEFTLGVALARELNKFMRVNSAKDFSKLQPYDRVAEVKKKSSKSLFQKTKVFNDPDLCFLK